MNLVSKLPHVGTTIFTVMSQLAAKHGAVNLGQGFPDFEGPQALREALTEAMATGANQYAPMPGLLALREQVAAKALRYYGRAVDPETEVTVTSGGTEALFAALAAVVSPGDEVILLDPCYDSYDPAVRLQGGVPVHVPLDPRDFSVDWERVKAAFTPRTRMILVNSPHNPTGSVFTAADLEALAELTRDTPVLVLSDEVYEHLTFDGQPHQSVLRHAELAARSFVIGSFGKTFHCTGWKVGSCIAPPALTAEFRKVHQFLTFCTFHPAQVALAKMLADHPDHVAELPAFYQAKRDRFRELLAGSRFDLLPVKGAYFQVAAFDRIRATDDRAFCQWLVAEAGVAAIPVSAFCERPLDRPLIRFCFAKEGSTLEAAAERLRSL
ncbi:MAG TPA: methionine aminotransferase [Holophagaceae bacterium]|nr:methionine aminotransferase [Holophagaceae bacterium]